MHNVRQLLRAGLLVSVLCGAVAVSAPADAQRVGFCGVVRFWRPGCVTVHSRVGRRWNYDISSAIPRPRQGLLIAGSGSLSGMARCAPTSRRMIAVTWRRVTACPFFR
jgi:hypothetical protein